MSAPQKWHPMAFANDEALTEESDITKMCKELEHYETPEWAAREILRHEVLSEAVIDPCCGAGVLAEAAREAGYRDVRALDIHHWGYIPTLQKDFLQETGLYPTSTFFMNPPFSKATEFVEKCLELGARKIVCFQRFAWWESGSRREFWDRNPPNRVYVCGDRATCWRHDMAKLPPEKRINPKTGKVITGSTPTAHAWFVWERGHPPGTLLGRIYKDGRTP